jgi:hypothetical protein
VKIFSTVAAAALTACVLLGGCSSSGTAGHGGTSAASASPIASGAPACAYLSESDVHQFGEHVSFPGKPGRQDYGATCDYGGAVFTLIAPAVSAKAFSYGATKQVSGLGDHAYYNSEWHWLRVASNRTRFELKCILCSDPELGAMTAVARSLVPRLPQ